MNQRLTRTWMVALGVVLVSAACAAPTPNDARDDRSMQTLQGSVWYRERMLLPPDAEITVRLEDVSRMDVAAEQIAQTRWGPEGGPPYAFELEYDPALISEQGRYVLRARIESDGRLLFINTTRVPAFAGAPGELTEIMVSRVAGTDGASPVSNADLTGTDWVLVELEGEPAPPGAGDRDVYMVLDASGRVSGFSGCNRFMGGYSLSGDRLGFSQLASTMMACPQGMDLEQRFLSALPRIARYKVHANDLALHDDQGKVILRFEVAGSK